MTELNQVAGGGGLHCFAVDGGGTKTDAALFTPAGAELARVRLGPANAFRDPDAVIELLAEAWRRVSHGRDVSIENTVIVAGIAGSEATATRQQLQSGLPAFAGRYVTNDARIAAVAARRGQPVALLVIGTGTIVLILHELDSYELLGGWGFPAGDQGGGAWLGHRLVQRYLGSLDGLERLPRPIADELGKRLGKDRQSALAWLQGAGPAVYGSLAPLALELPELVDEGARHLTALAGATLEKTKAPLVISGGLAPVYEPFFRRAFGCRFEGALDRDPLQGALLLKPLAARGSQGGL
ncbi:MAG: BadF/BadG/BcrA/BcrD ATPase family protein [Geminicoccaceae bacterium]